MKEFNNNYNNDFNNGFTPNGNEPQKNDSPTPEQQPAPEQRYSSQNTPLEDPALDETTPHKTEDQSFQPTEQRNNAPGYHQQPTGSYSYTGDRLTDNRTSPTNGQFGPTDYSRNNHWQNPNSGYSQNNGYNAPMHNDPNRYNAPQPGNSRYEPRTQYNIPQMNGNGEISYTPNNEQPKKKKKASAGFTKAGVAVICCATICLSAAAGFLGAYAATSGMEQSTVHSSGGTTGENTTAPANPNATAVIYRSVTTTGQGSAASGALTYSDVANMVQDSVVEIVTEFNNTSLWFQYVTSGAGSGVILSEDGYVVTNNHVIWDDDSNDVADNITVRLRSGEEFKATVIGTDSDSDIAVLKIEAEGLTPAVCGDSDKITVGEEVLAVGNPLGELGGTVTNGIVSATDREIDMGDVTMNLIQTNAAVNPGNSGGGLFNMAGELIGIVNAKSSGSDIEGLGFAIPINDGLKVAEQLLEFGYVRGKVMIGVSFLDATDSNVARYYGLKPGIYVSSMTEGYNDKNLKAGDRVIAINGSEVSVYEDITSIVKAASVGDVLTFQVYRDGKLTEAEVTVFEKIPEKVDFTEETTEDGEKKEAPDKSEEETAPVSGEPTPYYGGNDDFWSNFPWSSGGSGIFDFPW